MWCVAQHVKDFHACHIGPRWACWWYSNCNFLYAYMNCSENIFVCVPVPKSINGVNCTFPVMRTIYFIFLWCKMWYYFDVLHSTNIMFDVISVCARARVCGCACMFDLYFGACTHYWISLELCVWGICYIYVIVSLSYLRRLKKIASLLLLHRSLCNTMWS